MKSALALVAVVTCLGCGSSTTSSNGTGTGDTDGGTGSTTTPTTGDGSQYNTLKGTFVGTGINATITGGIQGTDNDAADGKSEWNGVSTFVRDASGVPPTQPTVTWTAPSGETATLFINIGDIIGHLVGGTFTCGGGMNPGNGTVSLSMLVQDASGNALYNYSDTTCTMTLDTTLTTVVSNGITVYYAHGSLTATLTSMVPGNEMSNGTGTLNLTW